MGVGILACPSFVLVVKDFGAFGRLPDFCGGCDYFSAQVFSEVSTHVFWVVEGGENLGIAVWFWNGDAVVYYLFWVREDVVYFVLGGVFYVHSFGAHLDEECAVCDGCAGCGCG